MADSKQHAPKQAGFSLVWVAAVALGVGVALAASAFLNRAEHRSAEQNATVANLERIEDALLQFAMLHRRLPCPADPGELGTGTEGTEDRVDAVTGECAAPLGVVPWRTLGLPKAVAFDGWERLVSYRVDDDDPTYADGLTRDGGLAIDASQLAGKGVAVDDGAVLLHDPAAGTGAAYVLVSHGPSGWAGVTASGARLPDPPAGDEYDNAHTLPPGPYHDAPFNHYDVSPDTSAHFDDILRHPALADLIDAAGVAPPQSNDPPLFSEDPNSGASPFDPSESDQAEYITSDDGYTGLKLTDSSGDTFATVYANADVNTTDVNADITITKDGIGVSSSSQGGGGANKKIEASEGLIFDFTENYKSLTVAMYGLADKQKKQHDFSLGYFVYLLDDGNLNSFVSVSEFDAKRQYALIGCTDGDGETSGNRVVTEFQAINAPPTDAFNQMKLKGIDVSNTNKEKATLYGITTSLDYDSGSLNITSKTVVDACMMWYCESPNCCGSQYDQHQAECNRRGIASAQTWIEYCPAVFNGVCYY